MKATHPSAQRDRSRRRGWDSPWLDLAASFVVSYLVLVPTGLLDMPPTVERITFENPTAYDIAIAVSDAEGDGWLPVTTVRHGGTASVTGVIDQGEVWQFRFRSQGSPGGELTVPRADLVTDDWRLTIPAGVGDRLAALGAPPSP